MEDLKRNIIFDNVQVAANGDITGKVAESNHLEETQEFQAMFEQMNEHFNNDQMVSIINYNPRQNEVCACKFASQWHRVKVEYILSRKNGHCASCVFVDEGSDELVPVSWLRQLPALFRETPFQVKQIYLHNIQPISMVISEDVLAVQKPVKLWDEAAVKFIHDCIKAAAKVKCVLMVQHSESEVSVRMYLEKRSGAMVCLNEVLVKQQYAINTADAKEELSLTPKKPKKTIEDVIRSGHQKRLMMMNNSDVEMCAKSDTEFTTSSRLDRLGSAPPDKGYNTDSLGGPVMSHRAIHKTPSDIRKTFGGDSWAGDVGIDSSSGSKQYSVRQPGASPESVKYTSESHRSLVLAGGDSDLLCSDKSRSADLDLSEHKRSLGMSEERSYQRLRGMDKDGQTTPQLTVTSPHPVPDKSHHLSSSKSPQSSSQSEDSSSTSAVPMYGRGGVRLENTPILPHSSPKVGLTNISPTVLGRGSQKYGRGALLSSTESLDNKSKQLDSHLNESDSEKGFTEGLRSSPCYGRGALLSSTESLNTMLAKPLGSPHSLVKTPPVVGQRSPNYGRGALFSSTESLNTIQTKPLGSPSGLVETTPVVRQRSPIYGRGALLSSTESLNIDRTKPFVGDGVVRPKQFDSDGSVRSKQLSGHYEYSDSEVVKLMGSRSGENHPIPDKAAHSENEFAGTSSISKMSDYHRQELARLGVFDDAVTQSGSRLKGVPDISPRSLLAESNKTEEKVYSRNEEKRVCHDYSSGCESSASSVGAVMLGQAGFKKSRLPKVALSSGGEVSDSGRRQSSDAAQRSPLPGSEVVKKPPAKSPTKFSTKSPTKSPAKSPAKTGTLQAMMKKMGDEDLDKKADRSDVEIPESALSGNKKMEMLGKFTGQRLMEKLGTSSRTTSLQSITAKKKDQARGMFGVSDGVLVHGSRPPKPFLNFSDSHFTEHVKQAWKQTNFAAPTVVQAYTWPNIIRGRHVVTISPPGTGKTLSYLYPLISGMSDPRIYNELPIGSGPLTIIIAQSWRRAENVYDNVCSITQGHPGLRAVLVYGGGEEDRKACTLINGCEILVVTAPSLKRLLEARYTELRRLCHLVIDDADQVLKTFSGELKYVLTEYGQVMSQDMKRLESPRQFLLLGSQWNVMMHDFIEKILNEPVLIVTAAFEASIYGRVKQVSHMCRPDDRVKKVIGILGNVTDGSHKTIIFATQKNDIVNLFQIVRNCSYYCLMVHQDMELYQVEHVIDEWSKELNLLICCDSYVSDLKISDATTVIHFDFPNSKTKFSNRLSCMRQHFYNFSDPDRKRVHEPLSHLIITERCQYQHMWHIYEMLQRTNSRIPPKFLELLMEFRGQREQDGQRDLCEQLLAFGFCRDTWRCPGRHVVMPEIDVNHYSNWIPDEGEIRVLVSHVVDASHYYVRLLSVRRDEDGARVTEDLAPSYSRLQMDVALWYSNLEHQKRETAPYAGEVCGYQENEVFYRVQIVEFLDMNTKQEKGPIEALVRFVDTGRVDEIPAFKLYELPERLRAVPFQAVEVYMCKLRPMDKDTEWTRKACMFMHELVRGKTLEGKIVLRVGYRLWLDPLVMRVHLGESRTIINKFYVHTELLRNGLAIENENHLKRLHKLCDGKVNIPKALLIKTRMSKNLQTDVLPACREHHNVQVSSVGAPDFFFVQRQEKATELEELMTAIKEYVEMMDDGMEPPEIPVGTYCLAEYTTWDKGWYRAQIVAVQEDSYEVFFADYGDKDFVPKDKVREFPIDRFFELPLQAIECQLAHIKPPGSQYDIKAGDILWDMSHFVNNDLKRMVATVTDKVEEVRYAGQSRFVVELHTKTDREDVDLASELVWRQLAVPEDGSPVTHLFSRPVGIRRMISSCLLIPELCAAVYWEQDPSRALSIAEEILSIIDRAGASVTSQTKAAVEATQCIVKLISRVPQDKVHGVLLDCLALMARANEMFVEEMLISNIASKLIHGLEMNSDTVLQQQAADFIAGMANLSTSFRTVFQAHENISVLYELFDYTQCEQVQGAVCRAFTALCSGSEGMFDYLMEMSVCPMLVKYFIASSDHSLTEAVILLISALSELDSSHADLKKDSLIEALVKNLRKSSCNKCIQHSVQMCDNFAATRRKHKTFLLELGMVPLLKRLLELPIQPATRQLCNDLMTSLIVKVPSEPMSGLTIRPGGRDVEAPSSSGVPPQVFWSQNSFNVLLSVKLSNVPNRKNIAAFKDNVVMFRVAVAEVTYSFTYTLYGNIIPASSKVAVRSQEILLSMKKQTEGKWPRLLLGKQKPANLFVDYERFVDSSCESELDDEDRPFVLKKKKKKPAFKGPGGKPRDKTGEEGRHDDSGSTDTDDSLEQLQDPDDRGDYDPFSLAGGLG